MLRNDKTYYFLKISKAFLSLKKKASFLWELFLWGLGDTVDNILKNFPMADAVKGFI